MKRKDFIRKGIFGATTIVAFPSVLASCGQDDNDDTIEPTDCYNSPQEIKGPFPHKTPAQLVKENIIGDRKGVPLLIEFTIEDSNNDCVPIEGAVVDLWHCDALGNYSQYAGQQSGDLTSEEFLRGRQTTDLNGKVSFISIFPGWYPGRAPHLHVEVISASGKSLLVTQTAFPESVSKLVYETEHYNGNFDTPNSRDAFFTDLSKNLPTSITGDTTNGYTLTETLKVKA